MEGAISQIHGTSEWCVTAALVRDNVPVLSVIHLPLQYDTYGAARGFGAFLNGKRLYVSSKPDLRSVMVGTGQAAPGEIDEVHNFIGSSVAKVLRHALTVRVSVPATLH